MFVNISLIFINSLLSYMVSNRFEKLVFKRFTIIHRLENSTEYNAVRKSKNLKLIFKSYHFNKFDFKSLRNIQEIIPNKINCNKPESQTKKPQ